MRGRALRLMKSYLKDCYIQVVVGRVESSLKRITSSVSQGGKWSANLWDFDIGTLEELDIDGLIAYADDLGILYEVTKDNKHCIIDEVNADFKKLEAWGIEWKVTFAADKTYGCLLSRKKEPFDVSGIRFMGKSVEFVKELKLVGFIFDEKITMAPMVKKASKKGRSKIAALFRLKPFLVSYNLETMYKAVI